MASEPYDASDPVQVADATRKAKRRDKDLDNYVKAVMGQPEGRKFIHEILSECGVFRNPHARDPYFTAFNCGEMNAGQRVLARVMAGAPELYFVMMKENTDG